METDAEKKFMIFSQLCSKNFFNLRHKPSSWNNSSIKTINFIDGKAFPVIIGIDVYSFNSLFSKNKKYAFLFYMQLIEPFYLCILLHITPHQNSFLNEDKIFKIKNICNQLKSDVLEISTDGDPNYNNESETIFKIYETMMALKGFEDAFSTYSNHFLRKFFGNLLHILKLAKSKILTTLAII